MSKYRLDAPSMDRVPDSTLGAFRKLLPLMRGEGKSLALAFVALLLNSSCLLLGPWLIGRAVDRYVVPGDYAGLVRAGLVLLAIYLGTLAFGYLQVRTMGTIGQRVLFALRNRIFRKLQELPVAFFGQNKAGDLIARISGDAQALNEFFAYQLMSFVGAVIMMIGAAIALLALDWRIGLIALSPGAVLVGFSWLLSPWTRRRNRANREVLGSLSGEISESLANFKVVVAFGRQDHFRARFTAFNEKTYQTAMAAGYANALFQPIYGLAGSLGLLSVLAYGISLVGAGHLSIGVLISALAYAPLLYDPVRQIGAMWMSLQTALAAWDRITPLLSLESDLKLLPGGDGAQDGPLLAFEDVSFAYEEGATVLTGVSLALERGKKYALVGPTGGGKTTTASLMARLFDPTSGRVLLGGRDIRSVPDEERTRRIGFILQDPFLFKGTIRENVLFGNEELAGLSPGDLQQRIADKGLAPLLARFEGGLETEAGDELSLGQKQLVAFVRAVLRQPDLLILDEATANVDTLTEAQLEAVLGLLPKETTLVTIAHRLNTIEAADQIFFVNGGQVTPAGSLEDAVAMLTKEKRHG